MRVNFDANASVRPLPEVLECLARYSGQFLNPSSVHLDGQAAKKVLDEARGQISELLVVPDNAKIIFTSGATEANNAALCPTYGPSHSGHAELSCSAIEHSAVLEFLRFQTSKGYKLKELTPSQLLEEHTLENELNDELRVFALMAANNETGQIFKVKNLAQKIKSISPRARVHCDAVQAIGKMRINFSDLGVESLALSGHKLGALSGVGALIIADSCQLSPWFIGGAQEQGYRAGTENVLGIQTLGIACLAARERLDSEETRMLNAKKAVTEYLMGLGAWVQINEFGEQQLPNTISVRFSGIKADDLVVALDLCGLSISAGSACASGRPTPSHVLLAHELTETQAKETVRISFEPYISESELEFGLGAIRETLARMLEVRRAA